MSGSGYFFVFHEVIQKPRNLFSYVRTWLGHRCPQSDPLPPTRRWGRKNRWRSHRIIFWGRGGRPGSSTYHFYSHFFGQISVTWPPGNCRDACSCAQERKEKGRDVYKALFLSQLVKWVFGCKETEGFRNMYKVLERSSKLSIRVRIQSGTWWSLVL